MRLAKHTQEGKLILVIYDSALHNTLVQDGNKQLDFTNKFYDGTEASEEMIAHLLDRAQIIHAAGQETIAFLEKKGFPLKDVASSIKGVPFVQILQE